MRIGANLLDTPGRRPYPVAPAHHALQSIHCMATSPFKQPGTEHPFGTETHREHPPLEVVHRADTPMEGVPAVTAGDPEVAQAVVPEPPPEAAPPEPPQRRHQRRQYAPYVDLYKPTWLNPLIKLMILDEHGPMPRTVQAQVGFASLLMGVQFCMDFLAWTLGFRWVFVNALGPSGWILTFLFAFLISGIIIIFERFVVTADVESRKTPIFLSPAILMRVLVVIIFATVTAIPVELLVFNDVIQGRLNGEVQGIRETARQQLRGDFKKDLEDLESEEGISRKRLKDEAPEAKLEAVATPKFDTQIKELQSKIEAVAIDLRQEEKGWRSGAVGQGPQWWRLHDEKEALESQLEEVKTQRKAELDRLTAANRTAESSGADRHFAELQKISDRYEPRKRDLEKKRRDIDRMTDEELKRATKKEFAVVDGFARRWKIMNDLEKEDPLYAVAKYAVRVLFVSFGLLVLTTKALFNKPTKAYFAGRDPLEHLE